MSLESILRDFRLSKDNLQRLAVDFQQAMEDGLKGKESSLKMIKSYITPPSGKESGTFLGLDLGGSNLRVLVTQLQNGQLKVALQKSLPLEDKNVPYNYKSQTVGANELFDFIAYLVRSAVDELSLDNSPLGFTFSWPCRQRNHKRAELLQWTKEMRTSGVEGQDIGELLEAALQRLNIRDRVTLNAIINDTVGTLLTGSFLDPKVDIGSILGTGHNTCYIEAADRPMIINIESGGFNELSFNRFDQRLDEESSDPGKQRLEKMVASKYLGELLRLVLRSLISKKYLLQGKGPESPQPYSILGEHLSLIIADDTPELRLVKDWIFQVFAVPNTSLQERIAIKTIAAELVARSASIVAATYLGILRHIDPQLTKPHTIAVDGSMYEHLPGYADRLKEVLQRLLGRSNCGVSFKLVKDGSGLGAGIAAATILEN